MQLYENSEYDVGHLVLTFLFDTYSLAQDRARTTIIHEVCRLVLTTHMHTSSAQVHRPTTDVILVLGAGVDRVLGLLPLRFLSQSLDRCRQIIRKAKTILSVSYSFGAAGEHFNDLIWRSTQETR